jgi:endonuclease/exonuclease/phosphatase family metal-dependent hydrolase
MPTSQRRNRKCRLVGTLLPILAPALFLIMSARADDPHVLTVMTRNMDAGTDLAYILAATDQASLLNGTAATFAEIKAADIPARASRLADEIAAHQPDVVALQEVTLWRTGPLMQPPASEVLYDQLDLLMVELAKRKLPYGVIAVQYLMDAEAPVPSENLDLRITDRNAILARIDLPQSQFSVSDAQTHLFSTYFKLTDPLLGEIAETMGWMTVDLEVMKSKVRVVNTHLADPTVPGGEAILLAQADELLASQAQAGVPTILAGDFNTNAEPGAAHTDAYQRIVSAGFVDTWKWANLNDPGYTWPLFGEDQLSGPGTPSQRLDLIFSGGPIYRWFGSRDLNVLSVVRTGTAAPWASDHAGVVMKRRID